MSGVLSELLCARCGHAADLHDVQVGTPIGCMVRHPEGCECPLTWEGIEARAIRRMTAGLPINTESDPDVEARYRPTTSPNIDPRTEAK